MGYSLSMRRGSRAKSNVWTGDSLKKEIRLICK